ncbi:MAG: NAD(P)/FAD-dependent oxidoreductase [Candidatus Firestonebacteria bacterium]
MPIQKIPKVVIVGAGFGGLSAARALGNMPVDVLLLDKNNYHTFLPLLYQVAVAELEPEEIAYPIRSILRKWPNINFSLFNVDKIDFNTKIVQSKDKVISYDFLILALGSVTNFFNVSGAEEHSFSLKTLEEAITLRNHILMCFENASNETDGHKRQQKLTFTVVGGGATGIEFAGALAELINGSFIKDYPNIKFSEVNVVIVEASETLLSGFPKDLCDYTQQHLKKMGVRTYLQSIVERITQDAVYLKNKTIIPTETVVWTAGVHTNTLIKKSGLSLLNSRIEITSTLALSKYPEVYVIGDLAYYIDNAKPLPMLAPVAVQQGVTAAKNIICQINEQKPIIFHYRNLGAMVTIGRRSAVAHIGCHLVKGFTAWLLWLSIHIFNLIGFRNRLFVLINWALDYFFYERTVRLILPRKNKDI